MEYVFYFIGNDFNSLFLVNFNICLSLYLIKKEMSNIPRK